jgi:hypothetical protein
MRASVFVTFLILSATSAVAQTEGARISGRVTDLTGAVIVGAECKITNIETDVSVTTTTNQDGIYAIPDLHPATYRLTIEKKGFRTVIQPNLQLYVQDSLDENFTLAIGPMSDTITVSGSSFGLRTDSAAVSTVVDDQFVQNMPLNGRSFQPLIALTPGIVFTSQESGQGQFSANGQRSNANYFMVDGVSANFGVTTFSGGLGETLGGAIPAFTAQGGTNGLVSVDAMQEFRIETSSYAPELGRTPGAQISIITKSGTNQFHGSAFDYLRNDIFDARNYFDAPPLVKPPLRQNDFGGTLGGPILKDKTFFFFSYEGLRLRLPQTASDAFYTASARAAVAPVYQPFLKALPLPLPNAPVIDPTCDNITNPCEAILAVAYSDPSSLNATSVRIDENLSKRITLFARYNHAPSYEATRSWEEVRYQNSNIDSVTAGATILVAPTKVNEFRANWSQNAATFITDLTNFHGGVVPPSSALFPSSSPDTPDFTGALLSLGDMEVGVGIRNDNVLKQLNFVDTFSWALGVHQLKFGIDYRQLNVTASGGTGYAIFPSYTNMLSGTVGDLELGVNNPPSVRTNNYSLFAEDTWKATDRLTLTYGLRWEINTPPVSTTAGAPLYELQGIFDSKALAAVPGPLWHTKFDNFAPRIGAAYQINSKTVARGGVGIFYDLGYGSVGANVLGFPFARSNFLSFSTPVPFDLSNPAFQLPPLSTAITANTLELLAVDPSLQSPYTLQWNVAVERQLGAQQTLTASYVGSDGRQLLRQDTILPPLLLSLGSGGSVDAIWNAGSSHYNALQIQFRRRMLHGLQALVSYTYAKSCDQGSSDTRSPLVATSVSGIVLPPLSPSDFDIRDSFAAAVSYEVPTLTWGRAAKAILGGWAVDGIVRASSAPPINITAEGLSPVFGPYTTQADIVPGQAYWIADPTQPAGRALNPEAFSSPPGGMTGDFPRNGLRSPYSINQTDLALRRQFSLSERFKLNVRVEYFNVFNHPMFGIPGSGCNPDSNWSNRFGPSSTFGQVCPGSTTNVEAGLGVPNGQNALYAVGGPRSAQFSLKLQF